MIKHEFNDDPNTPLNKKIEELADIVYENAGPGLEAKITELCREIYVIGHDEGQEFACKYRSVVL